MKPLDPIHPGRILLEEFLAPRGISVWHLAKDIGLPARRIYDIVQGERAINNDFAHRLAHYLGMSERFWLDLQARYDGQRDQPAAKEVSGKQEPRYAGLPKREAAVLRILNTPRPVSRTLVVVDGGLSVKTQVETSSSTKPKRL
jgi:antitoxin HigA-1